MKVVVFGVRHSSNVGDGLIGRLLELAIQEECAPEELSFVDFAGRSSTQRSPSQQKVNLRSKALRLHRALPATAVDAGYIALRAITTQSSLRSLAEQLSEVDVILIGPGQLMSARTGNFPAKLFQLSRALRLSRPRPDVRVFGCGYDATGSRSAVHFLNESIRRLEPTRVVMRDAPSAEALSALVGATAGDALVVPDLATLLPEFETAVDANVRSNFIDLEVVDHRTYDDFGHYSASGSDLTERFVKAVERLTFELGLDDPVLRVTSNGLPEDHLEASMLVRWMSAQRPYLHSVLDDRPESEADLRRRLKTSIATVGIRLHAVLPALALGQPVRLPHVTEKARRVLEATYGCTKVDLENTVRIEASTQKAAAAATRAGVRGVLL